MRGELLYSECVFARSKRVLRHSRRIPGESDHLVRVLKRVPFIIVWCGVELCHTIRVRFYIWSKKGQRIRTS